MNLISQIKKEVKNKVSGQIIFEENLSKYSWFNLGGPAKILFRPKSLLELSIFLKKIKQVLSQNISADSLQCLILHWICS